MASRPANEQKMLREHIEASGILDQAAIPRSLGPGDTQTLPERVVALYQRYAAQHKRCIELERLRDVHVPDFPPSSTTGRQDPE